MRSFLISLAFFHVFSSYLYSADTADQRLRAVLDGLQRTEEELRSIKGAATESATHPISGVSRAKHIDFAINGFRLRLLTTTSADTNVKSIDIGFVKGYLYNPDTSIPSVTFHRDPNRPDYVLDSINNGRSKDWMFTIARSHRQILSPVSVGDVLLKDLISHSTFKITSYIMALDGDNETLRVAFEVCPTQDPADPLSIYVGRLTGWFKVLPNAGYRVLGFSISVPSDPNVKSASGFVESGTTTYQPNSSGPSLFTSTHEIAENGMIAVRTIFTTNELYNKQIDDELFDPATFGFSHPRKRSPRYAAVTLSVAFGLTTLALGLYLRRRGRRTLAVPHDPLPGVERTES